MSQLTDQQKKQIETLLFRNYTIEAVAQMVYEPVNSVLGVWAGCKRRGLVPKDVKPGQIPGMAKQPVFGNSYPPASSTVAAYPVQPMQPFSSPQYQPQVQSFQPVQPAQPALAAQAVPPLPVVQQPPQGVSVEGSGVLMKVWNNPKNLFWFDLWRMQHPQWQGDFADFISESIEVVFKTTGWELVARKTRKSA